MGLFDSNFVGKTISDLFSENMTSAQIDEQGQGPEATPEDGAATVDTIDENSMQAILMDVLSESSKSEREVVKALIAKHVREIQRIENLLAAAKQNLADLMKKDPKEIAHSAAIAPSRIGEIRGRTFLLEPGE